MIDIAEPPEGKPATTIQLYDDPELFAMLNKYRRLCGWTWKRLFLIGLIETIHQKGDNPDLVQAIAEYMQGKR